MKRSRGRVRIVLDTNVLISGVLVQGGPPGALLQLWLNGRFTLVTSEFQLSELRRVLTYARVAKRLKDSQGGTLLDHIDSLADVVCPIEPMDLSPDPDDNFILATAVAGDADFIVSGDKGHMVALGTVNGIPILSPRDALARLTTD